MPSYSILLLDFPLYRFYEKADISVDVLKQGEFVIIFESRVEKCRELLQLAHNSNLKIVLIKNYLFRDHHYWQSVEAALGPNVLVCDMVQNLDWKWLLGKDTKPTYPETLYKICVHEPPLDKSIKGWSKYITLQPAITIESYIIAGFGRGGKMLGMPTGILLNHYTFNKPTWRSQTKSRKAYEDSYQESTAGWRAWWDTSTGVRCRSGTTRTSTTRGRRL